MPRQAHLVMFDANPRLRNDEYERKTIAVRRDHSNTLQRARDRASRRKTPLVSRCEAMKTSYGGSLTKIAYYSTVSHKRAVYNADFQKNGSCGGGGEHEAAVPGAESSRDGVPWEREVETGRLHFVKFETRHIEAWLRFVQEELLRDGSPPRLGGSVKLTGGGAFRHRQLIATTLGLSVEMEDELECLISGCNFLLKNITDEVFEYQRHGNPEYKFNNTDPNVFPYLLVNIGSGVSIMKVESDDKYERIGGSATGGGTFWGLGSLMTKAK
ncbi:hypothetical protein MTO96_051304, partial [Rhipicephalus appendiculatus]